MKTYCKNLLYQAKLSRRENLSQKEGSRPEDQWRWREQSLRQAVARLENPSGVKR